MPSQVVLWDLLESWTVTETFRLCSINIGGSIFNMMSTCAQLCSIRSIGTWVKLCWNLLHWWPQLIRRGWPDLEIRRAYFVIASCAHNRRSRPTVFNATNGFIELTIWRGTCWLTTYLEILTSEHTLLSLLVFKICSHILVYDTFEEEKRLLHLASADQFICVFICFLCLCNKSVGVHLGWTGREASNPYLKNLLGITRFICKPLECGCHPFKHFYLQTTHCCHAFKQ